MVTGQNGGVLIKPRVVKCSWNLNQLREGLFDPVNFRRASALPHYNAAAPDRFIDFRAVRKPTVFVATTQPKKFDQTQAPIQASGANIDVRNPAEILGFWLSANEESGDFTLNAFEKLQELLNRIYGNLGYDEVVARLKARGIEPEGAIFLVNDSGLAFHQYFGDEPEFRASQSLYKPEGNLPKPDAWPGVELGPVVSAEGGILSFMTKFRAMIERKEAAGEPVDLSCVQTFVNMGFKLAPTRAEVEIFSTQASIPSMFDPYVQPPKGVTIDTDCYMRPVDPGLPEDVRAKTLAEQADLSSLKLTAPAHAIQAFLALVDLPQTMRPSFHRVGSAQPKPIVATQAAVFPRSTVTNKIPSGVKVLKDEALKSGNSGADIFDNLVSGADGVLLLPHSRQVLEDWDSYFLDYLDMFSSLVVQQQLGIPEAYGKPVFLSARVGEGFNLDSSMSWTDPETGQAFLKYLRNIDPAQDPWLPFTELTRWLHYNALVKQDPDHLYTSIDPSKLTEAEQRKKLKTAMRAGRDRRIEPPDNKPEQYGHVAPKELKRILVIGSAGTEDPFYKDAAYEIGKFVAELEQHLVTGGGGKGVMGAASQGFVDAMERTPELNAFHTGRTTFSAIAYEDPYFRPDTIGKHPKVRLEIASTFGSRMEGSKEDPGLIRSDVAICIGPGAGTFQEIARWLRKQDAGLKCLQGKKMIIFDKPPENGGISLTDAFFAILPKKYHDRFIRVSTLDEAKAAIMQQLSISGRSPTNDRTAPVRRRAPAPYEPRVA